MFQQLFISPFTYMDKQENNKPMCKELPECGE